MLGGIGVGTGQEEAPVCELGAGVPNLLAVYHPVVVVSNGTGSQSGQVRSSARFAEQLAPGHLTADERGEEPRGDGLGGVDLEGGTEHCDGGTDEPSVGAEASRLLTEDALGPRRSSSAPEFAGPGQAGPSVCGQGALPVPATLEVRPGLLVVREPGHLPWVDGGQGLGMFG